MNKIIIGLVGEKVGGKGTAAQYLVEKYGAQTFRFSKILNDVLDRLYIPQTRENQTKMSVTLREAFGQNLFAQVIAGDAKNAATPLIVIDGIRRWGDVEALKDLPGFHLLYITAPVEIRWQRARGRGEKVGESEMSLETFKEEENLSTEKDIPEIGRSAGFMLDNTGSIEEYYASVRSILEYIKAGDFDHPHPHRNKLHPEA